jgi:hypothetical protein
VGGTATFASTAKCCVQINKRRVFPLTRTLRVRPLPPGER